MARSSQSVESLLRATFPIQVAVRTTEAVEQICSKNNLKFFELLKPFCGLSNNGELVNAFYTKCKAVVCEERGGIAMVLE